MDERMATGLPVITVERNICGFDHQEVGAELLKNWGLPESIYLPIRYHHDMENAPERGFHRAANVVKHPAFPPLPCQNLALV